MPPEDPDADVRLLCCRGRWRSLGEARAAEAYGEDRLRSNIELAVWLRRLLYEVGRFPLADVRLPALRPDAPPEAALTRDGFALLVGIRWADMEPRPVAFAVRFCAAWCGLPSYRAAQEGITYLIETEVIREVGTLRRMRLFLPGPVLREVEPVAGGPPPAPPPPPPAPPPKPEGWPDEEALISALVEVFDATEVPAEPPQETRRGSGPCRYASHRASDWRHEGGGPVVCGVCHPPADPESSRRARS